ncbi:hypothetical protein PGTUg99_023544 [Puccinia graminis f. sp. tritici]|uniref:Uncharacterized protein n=1 Tax=Puccinia graminis f. sp. tritici TaxID=56615 RepID=A0A5B0NFT7_PUCGR|nr:hypothetical protein PGTUg99_023544 [Puccinia graminis f. sp. tritici]
METDNPTNRPESGRGGTDDTEVTNSLTPDIPQTQKGNDTRPSGRTIATAKKSRLSTIAERTQNASNPDRGESSDEDRSSEEPTEVLGLLRAAPTKGNPKQGTTGQKRLLEEIDDPSEEEEQAAILKKAMTAQRRGDDAKADMFFDILAEMKAKSKSSPARSANETGALIPQKSVAMVGIKSSEPQIKEGGLSFYGKGVNTFKDMGLPTFFDKNMKELKGPLPLTIFNKKWQDAAVLFHADKRSKSEDSSETRDRYSGLKFQNEWEQSFSDWTINSGGPLRYATLLAQKAAFSGKSGQKPLKSAVAQRSGPFFAAHTRSVSGVVAESRYATLKLRGIPLRYAALTATVSVAGPALPSTTEPSISLSETFTASQRSPNGS